jgi:DNA-binding CsgD family transcriptional regulator
VGSIAEQLGRARLHPAPGEVPVLGTGWLLTMADGSDRPLSRVAALTQAAGIALRLGRASDCLAALDEQRAAAGDDPVALVWALTASSVCRCILGQLSCARADLAEARKACNHAAPLLAEPFWRFAETACGWLEGRWAAAQARAAALDDSQASPLPPAVAATVTALRMELLRGLGLPRDCRLLAGRLSAWQPAEMCAWALAALDADEGRSADALRRLVEVCDVGTRVVYRAALPLVLHRIAEIAFSCGDDRVTSCAADALAGLDQAAPLTEMLTGLAQAYATRDPGPAVRAQRLAEAEGAGTLAAEALTVRGQIGDEPATTLAAAHAAWSRIGASGKARTVAAAMRAAGLAAPVAQHRVSPAADQDALSERERALARLVHQGRTNQQIARALHISVKTVEAYLTRVYRKTSCSSRVELAVAVTERRIQVDE